MLVSNCKGTLKPEWNSQSVKAFHSLLNFVSKSSFEPVNYRIRNEEIGGSQIESFALATTQNLLLSLTNHLPHKFQEQAMNLFDLDPCPTVLILITLHSTIYSSASSTEYTSFNPTCEGHTTFKQPMSKATTFAHSLKTITPSIAHFLRSLDAICLNHIFFSFPEIFQDPEIVIRSYQSTSSIIWNSQPLTPGKSDGGGRLEIHSIPSPSSLSEQLEMIRLRGHVDTILVEMAVEAEERCREVVLPRSANECEEYPKMTHGRPDVEQDKDVGACSLQGDFRGLATECLRVLERMGGVSEKEGCRES